MVKKPIDIDSYEYKIGQNIARIRNKNGLTQSAMEDYGISRAYLGRIELGLHSLTLRKLTIVARALSVNVVDFFYDKNGKPIR
jgi:Helix-turn-helix.